MKQLNSNKYLISLIILTTSTVFAASGMPSAAEISGVPLATVSNATVSETEYSNLPPEEVHILLADGFHEEAGQWYYVEDGIIVLNAFVVSQGESYHVAFLSVNVNCGSQVSLFIRNLSPEMSDEELICEIYKLRNTVLADQMVGKVRKGTTKRYLQAEPQMALDLLYGYVTIDSVANYGGGVEWHGNPFVPEVTTQARSGHAPYEILTESAAEEELEATPSDAAPVLPVENQLSEA